MLATIDLDAYMRSTHHHPLLSREEEQDLARRYCSTGERALAHRLVCANLRLVVKIALEYQRHRNSVLDLVQEGNLGLVRAIEKFDPTRGVRLGSYASYWIRAYMRRYILANARLVKLGTTQAQRSLFFNLRREEDRFLRLGLAVDSDLIADRMCTTADEVETMRDRLRADDTSLDAPLSYDAGNSSRLDRLAIAVDRQPDHLVEDEERRAHLRACATEYLRGLHGRDRVIFSERWLAEDPPRLSDLGRRFGVSRERVRQVERRLLAGLRATLESPRWTGTAALAS